MVLNITSTAMYEDAVTATPVVVADFYATWCPPCKAVAPMIEQLEAKLNAEDADTKGVASFLKVDVDQMQELAADSGITAMPTFFFYAGGKLFKQVLGANFPVIQETVNTLVEQFQKKGSGKDAAEAAEGAEGAAEAEAEAEAVTTTTTTE